jgi:HPt (histidine-containing phosphotransfer) domain-containing protein
MQLDLILMDIQMPDMDGIRACELIHQLSASAANPGDCGHRARDGGPEREAAERRHERLSGEADRRRETARLLLRYQPGLHSVVPAALPPAEPVVDHNQTLDWQLALRQAAMKPDLAREMLQMLIAFMPEVRNKVEEQLVGEQPEGLLDLIHKLHGSCSYSGVPRLKKLCQTLESSCAQAPPPRIWSRSCWSCWMRWIMAREACRMGCKRIAALRASSGLRPTVRYSVGSPGKRKRHGWFPDRGATHLIRPLRQPLPLRPSAKPRRRYAPSSARWRRHWPALHPGYRWYKHAEYRIQPVLMHHANIRGQAAGNPDNRYVKALRHLRHPHRHFAVDRLAIDTPFAGDHQIGIRHPLASCSASVTISMPGRSCAAERIQRRAHAARRAAALKAQHVDI